MQKTISHLLTAAAALVLTGCAVPVYVPAANEVLAPVKMYGLGAPIICVNGKSYSPPASKMADAIAVPTGSRVSLVKKMVFDGGNVTSICQAQLSFMPKAGNVYVSNAGLIDRQCFIELVREDPSKETGVSIEPSVGPSLCQ